MYPPSMYPPGMPGGGGPYGAPGFGGPPPGAIHPAGAAALDPHGDPRFGGGGPPPLERLPRKPTILERVWSFDAMLVNSFNPPLTGVWIRAEYLHWDYDDPGNELLGAPLSTVEDPAMRFPVFDLATPPNLIGTGRVATLGGINLDDNQGARLTLGVPLTFGEFEWSGFAFDQGGTFGTVPEVRPGDPLSGTLPRFAATSTLLNGELFNNVQLWDEAFRFDYKVDVWGTDVRLVLNHGQVGEGFHIKPIVGARVLSVEEHLIQLGINSGGGTSPRQVGLVDTKTRNYLWGPMVGARMELEHRWFQLGLDPTVTLGLNNSTARVSTARFAAFDDPLFVTDTDNTDFSPVFEVKAWLRVPLTENLSVFGGYSVLYAPKVARPATSIRYDVNSVGPTSNVRARKNLDEWDAHGFNIGLEFVFP